MVYSYLVIGKLSLKLIQVLCIFLSYLKYVETALWTTEEITQFQYGLARYGRDFHLVARALQSSGMNKTVKACVEFYYVWKRMNTPADVKW